MPILPESEHNIAIQCVVTEQVCISLPAFASQLKSSLNHSRIGSFETFLNLLILVPLPNTNQTYTSTFQRVLSHSKLPKNGDAGMWMDVSYTHYTVTTLAVELRLCSPPDMANIFGRAQMSQQSGILHQGASEERGENARMVSKAFTYIVCHVRQVARVCIVKQYHIRAHQADLGMVLWCRLPLLVLWRLQTLSSQLLDQRAW